MEHQRVPNNCHKTRWTLMHLRNGNSTVYPKSTWDETHFRFIGSIAIPCSTEYSTSGRYKWLHFLEETTEILWDTSLKSISIFISAEQREESSMHHISSQDERWFPVFDWSGEPVFHKYLKWSFPSAIGRREGLCAFCLKWNVPREAWLKEGWISLQ